MKQEILKMIKAKPGTSFVELESIKGFTKNYKGKRLTQYYGATNIILWTGISKEAADAIKELVETDQIKMRSTPVLTYFVDGKVLDFPVAKSTKRKYKNPHWLPITFTTSDVP